VGGVRGDFGALQDLRRKIASVANEGLRRQLTAGLAEEARTQVHLGFELGEAPDGSKWPALKSREGQALRDTGRLRNSITTSSNVRGLTLSTGVMYAPTHQYGATIRAKTAKGLFFRVGGPRPRTRGQWVRTREVTIPRRQFMPEDKLSPRFESALNDEADRIMDKQMGNNS